MVGPHSRLLGITLVLAGLWACIPPSEPRHTDWLAQRQPTDVCYRVNLLDGLSTHGTDELHDLFDCLNSHGHLDTLTGVDVAFDASTVSDVPVGVRLIQAFDAAAAHDIDPLSLVSTAAQAVTDGGEELSTLIDLSVEWTWGRPASEVASPGFDFTRADLLQQGLVAPLDGILPPVAEGLQGSAPTRRWLSELLAHDDTARLLHTLAAYHASSDPRIRPHVRPLLPHLGEALVAVGTPQNNRWTGVSGHSLHDLVDLLLTGDEPVLVPLSEDLHQMLSDARFSALAQQALVELSLEGSLQEVPAQTAWMASVDRSGGYLGPGEVSALHGLLRMLAQANQPASCTVDIWVTELDIELGNVAVAILGFLADQDPDFVVSSTGVLSDVLGWSLSQTVLDLVVDSGACPVLTQQLVDDLQVVDTLYRPEAYDLLSATLPLLHAMKNGDEDQLGTMADIATELQRAGAIPAVEEAIRDLGPTLLLEDLMALLPPLRDPTGYELILQAGEPLVLDDMLAWLSFLASPQGGGRIGWDDVSPLARPLASADDTWQLLDRLGLLLSDPEATSRDAGELLPWLLSLDPELRSLHTASDLVGDNQVMGPALEVLAQGDLAAAMCATEPVPGESLAPAAHLSQLATDGTLDDLLRTVQWLIESLPGNDGP